MLQFEANPPCQEDDAKPLSLTSFIPVREFGMAFLSLCGSVVSGE